MNYEIRELSIGGILDHSLRLFRDNFKLFATLLLVLLFPVQAVLSVIQAAFVPATFEPMSNEIDPNIALAQFGGLYAALAVSIIVNALLYPLAQGAITYAVARRYVGSEVTVKECLLVGVRRWPKVFVATLLVGIAVGLGAMACIVPGIYIFLALYVVLPVIVFENAGIGGAISRSNTLMKGHKRRLLNVVILVFIISIAVSLSVNMVPGRYVSAVLATAVQALLLAFNCIVATVVYFSARCKVEDFDLELLASAVEAQSEEQPSTL